MNYLIEERRNALAAEYVLGTLRGGARRRYQQLMMQHQLIRETTWVWEQYINVLGHRLEPKPPADTVWQVISDRLGFEDTIHTRDKERGKLQPFPGTKLWQSVAGLATAAALVLAVLLLRYQPLDKAPAQYAVVQTQQAQALWLIEVDEKQIKVKATDKLAQQANNDYELWFVAADGRAPVSLGLLPQTGEKSLNKSDLFDTTELAALAVSLEPLGGSPNGAPTTVLYTTELISL
ncbi:MULTISPECIES: anti-sigma factor [Pseudoalteromonas]|uniref:Anti-sigma factor n=1 Tax=Pseudoalteromonas amylolytica TaxID=1859457 RepID=A0A1S1MSM2_9GAMM|nr:MULTISPECIES: anti-sigma factor [Pseudoalteromonas]OHU86254.1 anti-sigma factor [Pseudoalteromonas sp. JW3]OHU89641.1 anti-sigma factor [Pseudoalteromonas amylolytica]